jgi:hypothetical protein
MGCITMILATAESAVAQSLVRQEESAAPVWSIALPALDVRTTPGTPNDPAVTNEARSFEDAELDDGVLASARREVVRLVEAAAFNPSPQAGELLERLAALTPRQRINLLLYYGVLGVRSACRSRRHTLGSDDPITGRGCMTDVESSLRPPRQGRRARSGCGRT